MACYQSSLIQCLFPHAYNVGFDLGNVEIKEKGLKTEVVDASHDKFSLRGKDWKATAIVFYDWVEKTWYFCVPKTLGKKPETIHSQRNVTYNRVKSTAYLKTKAIKSVQKELLRIVDPKFDEIIKDIKNLHKMKKCVEYYNKTFATFCKINTVSSEF